MIARKISELVPCVKIAQFHGQKGKVHAHSMVVLTIGFANSMTKGHALNMRSVRKAIELIKKVHVCKFCVGEIN